MKRPCHWLGTYDNRTQRRTGRSMIRGAHDYQRIPLDFGGGVSVVSDQGMLINLFCHLLENTERTRQIIVFSGPTTFCLC